MHMCMCMHMCNMCICICIYQVGAMALSSAASPSRSNAGGKASKAEQLRLGCLAANALWMLAEVEATRHRLPVAQYAL